MFRAYMNCWTLQLLLPCCKLRVEVRNGHIKRITDQDIQSSVLEVMGTNVCLSAFDDLS